MSVKNKFFVRYQPILVTQEKDLKVSYQIAKIVCDIIPWLIFAKTYMKLIAPNVQKI